MKNQHMVKAILVICIASFFSVVAFGNITDFGTNALYVKHVLSMDTTFKSPHLMWRAIDNPSVWHAAYLLIIFTELLAAVLCWLGAVQLLRTKDKTLAMYGLSVGLVLYLFGFMIIGGEWFAMWQSQIWNGQKNCRVVLYFNIVNHDFR